MAVRRWLPRIYVGLENADALAAIDTATNRVIANVPIGQAPQANRLCSAGRHGLSQELRFSLFNAGRATMSADARSVTHKGSN